MRTLLVTGASGRIGRAVCPPLAATWSVRQGFLDAADRATLLADAEAVACDVTDPAQVDAAVAGADAVLHLAGIAAEADAATVVRVNLMGTVNVLDACRKHGVRRFVFASSNHVVSGYERFSDSLPPARTLDEHTTPWPASHYGAAKVHGEALTRWYVNRPGSVMTAACLRIGNTGFPDPASLMANRRMWSVWMSDRDLVQLVARALDASVRFGVYGGISGNTRGFLSLDAARRDLGYTPQDDAETFARERGYESTGYHFAPWQE